MGLAELVEVLDALLQGSSGLLEVVTASSSLSFANLGLLSILIWICMGRVVVIIGFLVSSFFNFMVDLLFLLPCAILTRF